MTTEIKEKWIEIANSNHRTEAFEKELKNVKEKLSEAENASNCHSDKGVEPLSK